MLVPFSNAEVHNYSTVLHSDNSDPHYLTLVRLPCKEGSSHSVHCFYEVLPPFTSIDPSLVLKIPGVVILNSMCSLTAIRYDYNENGPDSEHKSSAQYSTGCGLRKQIFSTLSDSNEPRLDQLSSENFFIKNLLRLHFQYYHCTFTEGTKNYLKYVHM